MDRRRFLKTAVAAGAATVLPAALQGCTTAPRRADGTVEPLPVDALLAQGARVMWVAPHPDDECFPGGLLARASIFHRNPLAMVVLTRGDGGECCRPEGCEPDVATVRAAEMRQVADMYRAELTHLSYWNAPLPVESFPERHEIYARWRQQGDPVADVVRSIRTFRPDLVVTFDAFRGGTGHPEHQLGSRAATTAARLAADATVASGGLPPHRITRLYHMQNRFWIYRMLGGGDPGPVTEVFDASLPALPGVSCADFMAKATEFHRTQENDMGTVRRVKSAAFLTLCLRQVDPFTTTLDPAEPGPRTM